MKTSKALLFAAAALLSFSCAKENLKETESPASSDKELVEMTFNAFAGEETKTAIGSKGEDGKYPVNWVNTDKIAVMDDQTDIFEFNYVSGNGTKATFTGKAPISSSDYFAVYPYMDFLCDGESYEEIILPQEQNGFASNISSGIMVAKADSDKNLKFKNVTAFIKLSIPEGITYVSFAGAKQEDIAGNLKFNFNGSTVSEISATGKNFVSFGDAKSNIPAGTYYLAVAPVELANGFVLEYMNANGDIKKEKGTKDPNLKPGEILDLGARDPFKPVVLTRGTAWEWTATDKTWTQAGVQTIAGHEWNLTSDATTFKTYYENPRGIQIGSSSSVAKTATLSSNYGETYGIDEIVVNASYGSGSDATLEVSVGGKKFVCENETSVALTTSATEYTFKSAELVAGDIIIKYTQTTKKAMYLKAIFVNPKEKTQLSTPTNLKATIDETVKNKINVSWDAVENAGSYSVTCSGVDDPKEVTTTSASFDNLDWSTGYKITVVAKVAKGDAAHLDSDAVVSETISIGAEPSLTVTAPKSLTLNAQGEATDLFKVDTNQDSWDAASSNEAFIVNKTSEGFTVSSSVNPTLSSRTTTITVTAGAAKSQTFKITQSAGTFKFYQTGSEEVVLKATKGDTKQVTIVSDYDWETTVTSDAKFTVTPSSFAYADGEAATSGTAKRQAVVFKSLEDNESEDGTLTLGTITFSNKQNNSKLAITVKQESSFVEPFITLSPESAEVAADVTTASFDIQSNVAWTVSTEATWLTNYTENGTGDGKVDITFPANKESTARTAEFTVASTDGKLSKTFKLTQKAAGAAEPTTETYTFSSFTSNNNVTFNSTNFTIKMAKNNGGTAPQWNANSSEARLYPQGSLTISSTKKISKVSFNYTINANSKGKTPTIDSVKGKTNAGTWNADSKTWSNTTGDTEITMSTSGSAGNLGFTSITVTFAE